MKFADNTTFLNTDSWSIDKELLLSRLDQKFLQRRLIKEESRADFEPRQWLNFPKFFKHNKMASRLLKITGLYHRGLSNSFDLELVENEVILNKLPKMFDDYRILHLSDLHLDMHGCYIELLKQAVQRADYDICVITGDFFSHYRIASENHSNWLKELYSLLNDHVYVVLGNHDSIRMLPVLERIGFKVLVNEAVHLKRGNDSLILSGVDDPHFFRLSDFRYYQTIDRSKCSILLAHSPELYDQAADLGVDLYLCGHTHGGQVCLPGGVALVKNARCPRQLVRGSWEHNELSGYTSRGSGVSYLPVRFYSPPEVTLHRLRSVF